jgi:diguanylate cyclase (GGDEF)-like protein
MKEGQMGLLILGLGQGELRDGQLEMLEILRGLATLYLSNAFLHEKIADLAAIDDMTRILNRRFGLLRLKEEFSRAVRHGGSLSVLAVDIDQFEQINGTYGREAGDRMLRSIAGVLKANIRAEDVLCRYEDDKFLIITPGTGLVDCAMLGERLRLQVEQNEVKWGEGRLSVSISLGVAAWPIARITRPEELINYADQALYHAKESGRNCTSAWCNHRALKLSALERDARAEPLFFP